MCKNSDENVLKNMTKNLNPSKGEINMLTRTNQRRAGRKGLSHQTGDKQWSKLKQG